MKLRSEKMLIGPGTINITACDKDMASISSALLKIVESKKYLLIYGVGADGGRHNISFGSRKPDAVAVIWDRMNLKKMAKPLRRAVESIHISLGKGNDMTEEQAFALILGRMVAGNPIRVDDGNSAVWVGTLKSNDFFILNDMEFRSILEEQANRACKDKKIWGYLGRNTWPLKQLL